LRVPGKKLLRGEPAGFPVQNWSRLEYGSTGAAEQEELPLVVFYNQPKAWFGFTWHLRITN
jgi:hypothetical protein